MNKCINLVVEILELYDLYNSHHNRIVADLSVEIGKDLGMNEKDLETLKKGALLHDVGKLLIHDDVLNKPGELDKDERDIIQTHPQIGSNLLGKAGYEGNIVDIANYHHEWWDGSGYPEGLKEKNIPLMARVVSLASAYHVMISKCIYSPKKTKDEAIQIITDLKGIQFDPEIVEVLMAIIRNTD